MAQKPFPPRTITIGANQLLLTDEAFLNGYQAGHLAYMAHGRGVPFSDTSLRELLMKVLEDTEFPEAYCVGYVVGWLVTFASRSPQASVPV
jgi:hypothetical protein